MSETNGEWARLSAAAVFDARLKPGPLRILAALASYVGKDGTCWPSVDTVAQRLQMTRRNVQEHISTLEGFGYLSVDRQSKGIKGRVVNTYTLHYPKLPEPQRVKQDFTLYEAQGVKPDFIPFMPEGMQEPAPTGEVHLHATGEVQLPQRVKQDFTQTSKEPAQ